MKPMIAAASPRLAQTRKTMLVVVSVCTNLLPPGIVRLDGKVNGIAAIGLQIATAPAVGQYSKAWQISHNLPELSLRY